MKGVPLSATLTICFVAILQIQGHFAFNPQHVNCISSDSPVNGLYAVPDVLGTNDTLLTIDNLVAADTTYKDCDRDLFGRNGNNVTLLYPMKQKCKTTISCKFTCTNGTKNVSMLIVLAITRTLNYNINTSLSTYTTNVQEMAQYGTALPLNQPVHINFLDCTHGTFTTSDYSPTFTLSTSGGDKFVWQSTTNSDSLKVNGQIDYETNQEFHLDLNISFSDIRASTTTNIDVTVDDVDDNDPRFNISGVNAEYVINITEKNTTLVNVTLQTVPPIYAYDPDFGIKQNITYSISDQEEPGLFQIEHETGHISVIRTLDREKKNTYRIIIKAAQTDNPSKAASAVVRVHVTDIDDHLPTFKPEKYTEEVTEHSASGTYVAKLTASDPDEGDNANFTCVLFNTSLPLDIDTVADGCLIRVSDSETFDTEAFPGGVIVFEVGAHATLRDVYGTNNASVTVTLKDINDNTPRFTEDVYTFNLETPNGSTIGLVKADDPDEGGNGNVTYSVKSSIVQKENCVGSGDNNEVPFLVGQLSGVVRQTSEPRCASYHTMVEACDNPAQRANRRCSFAQLIVSHNNTMEVGNFTQEMDITENSPIGTYVDQLMCNGNGYTYSLDSQHFRVDTIGFLKTSAILDRENTSIYNLQMQGKDQTMKVVCNINVTVIVRDVNDNAPVFVNSSYTFSVPDKVVDGQTIGSVSAGDEDEGVNADISYHFQSQSESRFEINDTTGEIRIKSAAMVTACDVISIGVMAKDGGTPSMDSFAKVYVAHLVHVVCHVNPLEVPISTPLLKEEIEQRKQTLERDISQILNMTVAIAGTAEIQGSPTERTRMLLSSTDPTVSQQHLLQAVILHYDAIKALFYSSPDRKSDSKTSGNSFGAAEIALIAMGVVILIGTIVAIVVINKQFNSHKRYKQLYESLTRNSSLYESQEIKVQMDNENSDCDGLVNTQDIGSIDSATFAVSAVNPGFVDDEETNVKQTNLDEHAETTLTSDTDVKDAMDSLDDVIEHSTTEEDIPLVQTENENDSVDDEFSPAVYANVKMNDLSTSDDDAGLSQNGENKYEFPPPEEIALNNMNVEADINHAQNDSATEDNGTEQAGEEPNPDYDVKQVRFSGEVLDADENRLQPLKLDKERVSNDEESHEQGTGDLHDNTENEGDIELETQGEPGWLEEEIESPRNTVTETDNGKDFFFCDDALTHL